VGERHAAGPSSATKAQTVDITVMLARSKGLQPPPHAESGLR
jgi:hypothetical protein